MPKKQKPDSSHITWIVSKNSNSASIYRKDEVITDKDFISAYAEAMHTDVATAKRAMKMFFATLFHFMVRGHKISLRNIGVFKWYYSHNSWNPALDLHYDRFWSNLKFSKSVRDLVYEQFHQFITNIGFKAKLDKNWEKLGRAIWEIKTPR